MGKLACILLALLCCGSAQAQRISSLDGSTTKQTSKVNFGGHMFELELAKTPQQWQKGLSLRTTLSASAGMLFVFPVEQPLQFWMKDTLIPLDIIYFNSNGSFNSVHKNVPPCKLPKYTSSYCPTYPSDGAAQYVVELKGGTLDQFKIAPQTLLLSTKGL